MSAHAQVMQQVAAYAREAEATEGWTVDYPTNRKTVRLTTPNGLVISVPMIPGERVFKQFEAKVNREGLHLGTVRAARKTAEKATAQAQEHAQEAVEASVEAQQPESVPSDRLLGSDSRAIQEYPKHRGPDGLFYCPECAAAGIVTTSPNPQGLSAHRRGIHKVSGTTYRQPVVKVTQDDPLANVGIAMDMLLGEVRKVTAAADPKALEEALERATTAERERATLWTEHEPLAEAMAKIRQSVETLPMAQAFAAIVDIIGDR